MLFDQTRHSLRSLQKRSSSSGAADTFELPLHLKQLLFVGAIGVSSFGLAEVLPPKLDLWYQCALLNASEPIYQVKRFIDKKVGDPRLFVPVLGANAAVWLAWQIAYLKEIMQHYFLHHPSTRRVLPLVLSCFSHSSLLHLGFNMAAFVSFAEPLSELIGGAQVFALYVTAGAFSSMVSSITSLQLHRLLDRKLLPGLGASGAIFGIVAATTCAVPDIEVLLLPPFNLIFPGSLPAPDALRYMATFDLCALAFFPFMGHAAHLGGLLAGLGFVYYDGALGYGDEDAAKWWQKAVDQGHNEK